MKTLVELIDEQSTAAGLESFATFPKVDLASLFGRVYSPKLFIELKDRINGLFKTKEPVINATTYYSRSMQEWAGRQNYIDFSPVIIYRPIGLNVPFVEYIDVLATQGEVILKIREQVLTPTLNMLGLLINNPTVTRSNSGLDTAGNKIKVPAVPDISLKIGQCFDKTNTSDEWTVGKAIRQMSELEVVVNRSGALLDNCLRSDPAAIQATVNDIMTLTEKLAELIRNNPEYEMLSKSVASYVANRIRIVAEWVELYAVYLMQVKVLNVAVADSLKKLEKIKR